jgi:hypothetical protein
MITLERREDLDMELAEARALVTDKTDKDITVRHLNLGGGGDAGAGPPLR